MRGTTKFQVHGTLNLIFYSNRSTKKSFMEHCNVKNGGTRSVGADGHWTRFWNAFWNTTVDGQSRRKIGDSGRIFGAARVVSAVAGRHRLNGQNGNSVAQFVDADAALVRRDLMAVKEPAEHQRRVAFGRRALDDHEVAGVERLIAEGERRDSRRHCQQPKFKNLRRENSLVFFLKEICQLCLCD